MRVPLGSSDEMQMRIETARLSSVAKGSAPHGLHELSRGHERDDHRTGALDAARPVPVANEGDHIVAARAQLPGDRAADEAGTAGDESTHQGEPMNVACWSVMPA